MSVSSTHDSPITLTANAFSPAPGYWFYIKFKQISFPASFDHGCVYTVSLTVTGPGGESLQSQKDGDITVSPSTTCPFESSASNPDYIDQLGVLRNGQCNGFYGRLLVEALYANAAEIM